MSSHEYGFALLALIYRQGKKTLCVLVSVKIPWSMVTILMYVWAGYPLQVVKLQLVSGVGVYTYTGHRCLGEGCRKPVKMARE